MTWPTAEQFDAAADQGAQTALEERRNGAEGPRESPLSGEWADTATPRSVARDVGFILPGDQDFDAVEELASAWERGYFDTWAHEDSVQAEEDRED